MISNFQSEARIEMKFENLRKSKLNTTTFTLSPIHVTYANTLRRIILTGIDTIAFRSDMTTTGSTTDVVVKRNDTPMTNEMLADRIGLIPIHITEPLTWKDDKYTFTINVAGDKDKITIFQDEAIGEYFAYYEFRLFIAWYLEYAEKNKPDIYKKIMANTNLRIAYTLLDDGFRNDIKDLQILVKKNSSWGYDYNEKEYAQYVKELLVSHEKTLTKFRIEGVNKENYKEKLK